MLLVASATPEPLKVDATVKNPRVEFDFSAAGHKDSQRHGRILVPVDGSETSTSGLNEAIMIAKAHGGQLRLVHIVNEPVLEYNHSPGVYANNLIESLVKAGRIVLDVAETAAQRQGVKAARAKNEAPERTLVEALAA